MVRKLAVGVILVGLLCSACGKSGQRETRPIEVLFYVNRPAGAQFEVIALQGTNADHRFDGRIFEAPHVFVLENTEQPVKGVFRNVDAELPLTVELNFGLELVNRQDVPPGVCCTVAPDSDCTQADETCEDLEEIPMKREVVFEVFSVDEIRHIGFSATIGDLDATNITACSSGSDICLTPATFFLEEAKDIISGVFTKFSDQDPSTVFQVDLYVNGTLRESDSGTRDLIVSLDL